MKILVPGHEPSSLELAGVLLFSARHACKVAHRHVVNAADKLKEEAE